MKVAYLITAFGNYEHLRRLITALSDNTRPDFYLHIDKKSDLPQNLNDFQNVIYIKRRKVWWGGWSHTQAILDLMKESSKSSYNYHVLLSGTDYPIRPNSFLYKKLKEGGEYFNILKGFQLHKPESRIKYYFFDRFDRKDPGSLRTKFYLMLEKRISKILVKKKYPFKDIYHGSTWWALTGGTVKYIVDELKNNKELILFFKSSWCPEEALIPTILGNSKVKSRFKNNLTFTDWSTNPSPAMINKDHLELFKTRTGFENVYGYYEPFFARKFCDDSRELVKEIDQYLRRETD